jgi:AraC-like DNA-binding protein
MEIHVASASSRLLRVSTEMFPARERFSAFREDFARRVLAMDIVDYSAGQPRLDIAYLPLGATAAGSLVATPCKFIRDNVHVKDGSDDFRLDIVDVGPIEYSHAGVEHAYERGWAYFSDQARPMSGFGAGKRQIRNLRVKSAALKALVAHPEDLAGRPVHPGSALVLLDSYLRSLTSLDAPLSPELAETVGVHLLDLLAAVLGPRRDAQEVVAQRGVKAAYLRAILAGIARHSSDPDFDLDCVASKLGLSRRYIQLLLQETGNSFTEHVVERRLSRSYEMLTDQRYRELNIAEIALAAGFSDISHFNRMFRRRYGDTPSGVRHDSRSN